MNKKIVIPVMLMGAFLLGGCDGRESDEFHSLYPFEDFDRYEGPMHFTVIGNRYENPELLKEEPTC